MRRISRALAVPAVAALAALPLAACSDDETATSDPGGDSAATSSTLAPATTAVPTGCAGGEGPLRIVLVNDDGMINPAIDVMIDRFERRDDVELTVVAPAEERSGSSDSTTPGGAAYEPGTTPGGNEGYAVHGFPADAVNVALDDLGLEPHLVLSGINPGHNFGPFASLSGTVGVGRTAIRRDIPALAVSGGLTLDLAQFEAGADLAEGWIDEHCQALLAGEHQTDTVTSINIPACPPAQWGPLQDVPRATEMPELPEGENIFESSCDLADPSPANDVLAVRAGYPSITQVPAEL